MPQGAIHMLRLKTWKTQAWKASDVCHGVPSFFKHEVCTRTSSADPGRQKKMAIGCGILQAGIFYVKLQNWACLRCNTWPAAKTSKIHISFVRGSLRSVSCLNHRSLDEHTDLFFAYLDRDILTTQGTWYTLTEECQRLAFPTLQSRIMWKTGSHLDNSLILNGCLLPNWTLWR